MLSVFERRTRREKQYAKKAYSSIIYTDKAQRSGRGSGWIF